MLKRKCSLVIASKDGKKAIYIDAINKKNIMEYLNRDRRHIKKFYTISEIVLSNLKNTELYDKENINEKCKDVTAMKFFKGQENDRIYCKEVKSETKTHIIIMCVVHEKKKSTKLTQKEKNIIKSIAEYQYEIK